MVEELENGVVIARGRSCDHGTNLGILKGHAQILAVPYTSYMVSLCAVVSYEIAETVAAYVLEACSSLGQPSYCGSCGEEIEMGCGNQV